jgi:hypothetical protein
VKDELEDVEERGCDQIDGSIMVLTQSQISGHILVFTQRWRKISSFGLTRF